jgi:hypothetical protein
MRQFFSAALVRTKINSVIKQQKERAFGASQGKPARSFNSLKAIFEIWEREAAPAF